MDVIALVEVPRIGTEIAAQGTHRCAHVVRGVTGKMMAVRYAADSTVTLRGPSATRHGSGGLHRVSETHPTR